MCASVANRLKPVIKPENCQYCHGIVTWSVKAQGYQVWFALLYIWTRKGSLDCTLLVWRTVSDATFRLVSCSNRQNFVNKWRLFSQKSLQGCEILHIFRHAFHLLILSLQEGFFRTITSTFILRGKIKVSQTLDPCHDLLEPKPATNYFLTWGVVLAK